MFGDQPLNFTRVAAVSMPQQYLIVQASGTGYGGLATSKTQVLIGVSQNLPSSGEFLGVCPLGRSRIVAGAAVTAGSRITSNGSGRAIAAGSGDSIIGVMIDAAAADGDTVEAWINMSGDKM